MLPLLALRAPCCATGVELAQGRTLPEACPICLRPLFACAGDSDDSTWANCPAEQWASREAVTILHTCGHAFHTACIRSAAQRSATCPIDRRRLDTVDRGDLGLDAPPPRSSPPPPAPNPPPPPQAPLALRNAGNSDVIDAFRSGNVARAFEILRQQPWFVVTPDTLQTAVELELAIAIQPLVLRMPLQVAERILSPQVRRAASGAMRQAMEAALAARAARGTQFQYEPPPPPPTLPGDATAMRRATDDGDALRARSLAARGAVTADDLAYALSSGADEIAAAIVRGASDATIERIVATEQILINSVDAADRDGRPLFDAIAPHAADELLTAGVVARYVSALDASFLTARSVIQRMLTAERNALRHMDAAGELSIVDERIRIFMETWRH